MELGERSYNIVIKAGSLMEAGTVIREVTRAQTILLVSNPRVFALYGQLAIETLTSQGFRVEVSLMPDGEQYKNMEEMLKVLDAAVEGRLERSGAVAALGGGVVGDLAGFAAAIFQRGIDFIQIPTTLLAQVDSSVGGKVAVNHPRGKNLIGAFHQPRLVVIDPATLNTLDDRDFRSGLGEVVKYGIIYDQNFFTWLESQAQKIIERNPAGIEKMIYESCRIKSEIVALDEKEEGLRAVLNLGHTFGHALEQLGDYHLFRHGEAVVMGTMAAAYMSLEMGLLTGPDLQRISKLFTALGIGLPFPSFSPEEIYAGMQNDKKVSHNRMHFVIPQGIGQARIVEDPSRDLVFQAIKKAQGHTYA
ncbi:MAG TPA: 3-dehydroquinate synthase [Syntrophomonadaceae bacterium]|nr:3-dehydroquinate synthase [Syntrophomonadaceae bacterium]